jgi:hypothetical protein
MRHIALFLLALTAAGCVTSRQVVRVYSGRTPSIVVLSRRAKECSVMLTPPGYEPRTIAFDRVGAPMNRDAIKDGLLIGGFSAIGTALSGGTSRQRVEAVGSGLILAGLFVLGDEVIGARDHFEPEFIDVKLDRAE